MKRIVVNYQGHVQGVGFRMTTQSISRQFDVVGYVMNLADGSVEMVAEGTPGEIARFQEAIHERLGGYVRNETVRQEAAQGAFSDFSVRY